MYSNADSNQRSLVRAVAAAHRSSLLRFRTGAFAESTNRAHTNIGWSHRSDVSRANYPRSVHAELHALIRSPFEIDSVYIATISRKGYLTSGKPCKFCVEMLYLAGVKFVAYTRPSNPERLISADEVMDDPSMIRYQGEFVYDLYHDYVAERDHVHSH